MFVIGVYTTTKRVSVTACWPWVSLAMAAGILPVLLIVYLTGTAPLNGSVAHPDRRHRHRQHDDRPHARGPELVHPPAVASRRVRGGLSLGLSRAEAIRLTDPDSAAGRDHAHNDQTALWAS